MVYHATLIEFSKQFSIPYLRTLIHFSVIGPKYQEMFADNQKSGLHNLCPVQGHAILANFAHSHLSYASNQSSLKPLEFPPPMV